MLKLAGPKVSLDFDDTFNTFRGKKLALELLGQGYDVYIVTRRHDTDRQFVERTVKAAGINIPSNHIYFTNGALKWKTLQRLGIKRHYDNSQNEIDAIKANTPEIKGIKF